MKKIANLLLYTIVFINISSCSQITYISLFNNTNKDLNLYFFKNNKQISDIKLIFGKKVEYFFDQKIVINYNEEKLNLPNNIIMPSIIKYRKSKLSKAVYYFSIEKDFKIYILHPKSKAIIKHQPKGFPLKLKVNK